MGTTASERTDGQTPGPLLLDAAPSPMRYLTMAQTCEMTHYHRTTIQRAVDAGELTRYGLPRAPRFLEHEVVAWMNAPRPARAPRASYNERAGLPGSSLRW
jgi:predicted DNA-binding transcriptional regulator AlpA